MIVFSFSLPKGSTTGKPSNIRVLQLEPQPGPGAREISTSMDEPGSSLLSRQSSLERPPKPESLDPPDIGNVMGGMGVGPSTYAGVVCSPGVEAPILDAIGSYMSSRPNSLFRAASLVAVSVSLGVAYGLGTSGPGVCQCQCGYWVSSAEDVVMPVILACSCLLRNACCCSGGNHLLLPSALARLSFNKASVAKERSYKSSVTFSRLFRAMWCCCC